MGCAGLSQQLRATTSGIKVEYKAPIETLSIPAKSVRVVVKDERLAGQPNFQQSTVYMLPATPPTLRANAAAGPFYVAAQQAARISQRSGQVVELLVDDLQGVAARCGLCTDGPRIFASSRFLAVLPQDYQVAVFAHEFAHGDLGHVTIGKILSAGMDAVAQEVHGSTKWSTGATLVYGLGKVLTTNVVSRQSEREADLYAAQRLPLAGLPSKTLAEALRYITMQQGNSGGGWLSTHPSNPERIAAIEQPNNRNTIFAGTGSVGGYYPTDLVGMFQRAFEERFSANGVPVVRAATEEGVVFEVLVRHFRLDFNFGQWIGEAGYVLRMEEGGKLLCEDSISEKVAKFNIFGYGSGEQAISEVFSKAVNRANLNICLSRLEAQPKE